MNTPKLILAECRNWFEDVQFQFIFKILNPKTNNFDPFTLAWVH